MYDELIILYHALLFLLLPMTAVAQDIRREQEVTVHTELPDTSNYSDPSIRQDMEEWLSKMPTVIAPNESHILDPIEPDFLGKMALKDKPNFLEPDWEGIMITSKTAETNHQLEHWGKWLAGQSQVQAGGAMTIGIDLGTIIQPALKKLLKKLNIKSKRQRQREKLEKILEEY